VCIRPSEAQAVGDDGHAAHRHGRGRHRRCEEQSEHRVERARRHRDAHHVVRERPEEILLDDAERAARQPHRLWDPGQVAAHERHVAGLDRHVGAGAHGDADIGLGQGRRVVEPVAHHSDHLPFPLQPLHLIPLVLRKHLGTTRSSDSPRDAFRRARAVSIWLRAGGGRRRRGAGQ
jgi:hypothetical protein